MVTSKVLSPKQAARLRKVAVNKMLTAAGTMPKGDWQSYSACKRMIAHVPFSPKQYDVVMQQLVKILQI